MPFFLALKAEALYLADRAPEAIEAIAEAEVLIERFEDRHWCAELRRGGSPESMQNGYGIGQRLARRVELGL
jgi:hypothetical protein